MPREYTSDDLLPLSGIQHFMFCRRQWALIHVEQQWRENTFTAEGRLLHQRVDDPFFTETRNGVIIARSVPVASYRLGLSGICDVVEFSESEVGVNLPGRQGTFLPVPVEYKRGRPKSTPVDEVQLCAQAICLEEMLSVAIPVGYLYYAKTRHRTPVELTDKLRQLVDKISAEMHAYYERGYTPRVRTSRACRSCSLAEICLPRLQEKSMPVSRYIHQWIDHD
ncbi:CRISPR-associated exonuclease, Cas4 family [Bellilinea caldifistulae]|uniref:CRISPR-associated exonuclease Cas4 n=1 Tax=Bellilinea caldifistulae TaxID=360411 RepID=A0A0P6WXX7_9CHLR|nr:CRISPR-associated protein Cas4 [Bellilinea caldifistulae]KPL71236.1 CRISPR-associated protein Cas4 [Bellilinea caldifistulae]GAP10220.1 CRISPR-associated exonuclease, Cas4 family [Bellilinea caldifistulae]